MNLQKNPPKHTRYEQQLLIIIIESLKLKVKNEQLKQMHSSFLVLNLNMVFYKNNSLENGWSQ